MTESDVRWKQRLKNFSNALAQLGEAVELQQQRSLSKLEKQGLVKAFEFIHELAWKVMKDYFFYQGNSAITGSRDATREAFQNNLVQDGDGWMDMIAARNKAVHTYDEATVNGIIQKTCTVYYPLLRAFEEKMRGLADAV